MDQRKSIMKKIIRLALVLAVGGMFWLGGCAANGPQATAAKTGVSAEAAPEGIRLSFSSIPPETTRVFVNFSNTGEAGEPAGIMDIKSVFANITGASLDELKAGGTLVCPFVRAGRDYDIGIFCESDDDAEASEWIFASTVAGNGVYFDNNVELALNEARTAIALVSEPVFSSELQSPEKKYQYGITIMKDDYWSIGVGDNRKDNNLSWEFDPELKTELAESGYLERGTYPAFATAYREAIHDDITWSIEVAKTEEFSVSF